MSFYQYLRRNPTLTLEALGKHCEVVNFSEKNGSEGPLTFPNSLLTLLGQGGGLNQPALFLDGYFSMKKGVLILYELSENQKKNLVFHSVLR